MDFTGPDIDIDVIQDQMLPHAGKPLAQALTLKEYLAVALRLCAFLIQDGASFYLTRADMEYLWRPEIWRAR